MKKILFVVCFISSVFFLYAESNWTETLSNDAKVTIIRPTSLIGNVNGDRIIYNQELLSVIGKGQYLTVSIPAGDNLFFIDYQGLDFFEDACLIEAEESGDYYILIKPVYGYTLLERIDEETARKEMQGLKQATLSGDLK